MSASLEGPRDHAYWHAFTGLAAHKEATGDFTGFAATSTTTVTNLIPADVYSNLVLEALYAERQLAGVVAATQEDLTGEAGSIVQVPFISARTAQTGTEGTALTDNASSVGTHSITLGKLGDFDIVNNEVFEDQNIFDAADFLRNMTRALAEQVDQDVYDELETATPGQSEALATAGDLSDLYDRVVDLKAAMEGDKVMPSHVIMHPDVAQQPLKDTSEGIKLTQISASGGRVLEVAGLQAIVTPLANALTATLNEVQAIVIDSTRAVGEAWGRRPTTKVDDVTLCESDQTRLLTWLRHGTDELDTTAIGHVVNPAS